MSPFHPPRRSFWRRARQMAPSSTEVAINGNGEFMEPKSATRSTTRSFGWALTRHPRRPQRAYELKRFEFDSLAMFVNLSEDSSVGGAGLDLRPSLPSLLELERGPINDNNNDILDSLVLGEDDFALMGDNLGIDDFVLGDDLSGVLPDLDLDPTNEELAWMNGTQTSHVTRGPVNDKINDIVEPKKDDYALVTDVKDDHGVLSVELMELAKIGDEMDLESVLDSLVLGEDDFALMGDNLGIDDFF
ncbi:hypothetical protein CASFOL_004579 [Castilleja foliolosa]|uniref:Uncharacterized protein n=1 Tax=Castilleja foliolosa TaxID=1961234 RepID=A0ABD3ECW7_9LAMI